MRLVLALLFTVTAANAQEPFLSSETPTTMTQYDKTTGAVMGTTTMIGNRAYLRDRHGELFATFIIDADGHRRMVDPDGQPIDVAAIKRRLEAK